MCGVRCWDNQGYSIGTPVLNRCFNITLDGNVAILYDVHTFELMVDSMKSRVNDQITINDNVIHTVDTSINGRCNICNNLSVRN